MLDHACRAGILEAVGRGEWTFTHGVFELYFAAEYAGRHASAWAVLCPKYRTLLNWAARLLARRGDETATGAFLNGMAGLQEDRLGLRWLALADLIAEHDAYRSATAQNLCARIEAGLRELARIDSGRLRDAIRRLAVPLGWDDIVLEDEVRVEAFEPDPAPLRTNLRALLALLGRSDLECDGEAALRDRRVLGALIDAGLRHPEPDAAMRSAAWLHAAPLGEVLVARIFPPSLRLAVEAVADAAVDRALPEASRRAAWSALRRVDLLPVLAAFGETYLPQVHTLRLELGVGLVQARDEEWVVLGGADEG